jgi:3-hydroxyacyl-CoA dehydrogenase
VNEGARILEEVIALRASDIDLVYLTGYGFPLYRGGPMVYASCVDLAKVLLPAQRFTIASNGHAWHVALLLQKLTDKGKAY